MVKKRQKVKDNPYLSADSPEELGPSDRIAFEIFAERRDLRPSVDRIMNAGLDDDNTLRAMTMFRDAIGATDDPHRDPRACIADCGG